MEDMFKAARDGDLAMLNACIEQGCDVNIVHEGATPICRAAANGHLEACMILIERGAKLKLAEAPEISALCRAVEGGRLEMVTLLLPYCDPRWEFQAVERAVSNGHYDVADFLLRSGKFMFNLDTVDAHLNIVGASMFNFATCQNWQQFLLDRPDRLMALDPLYIEYALVFGAMECEGALDMIQLILKTAKVDINCRVRIQGKFETPLAAAAEAGNLDIIRFLLEQPGIDATLCGRYGWPPFLRLLINTRCVLTSDGLSVLQNLSAGLLDQKTKIYKSKEQGPYDTMITNALKTSCEPVMEAVIKTVRGAAGNRIIPLLVRMREREGMEWVLRLDHQPQDDMSHSWVLVSKYLHENEDAAAFELFVDVADTYSQWNIWLRAVLMCLESQNFLFLKQFFFRCYQHVLDEHVSDTLRGFTDIARNDKLIEEWVASGHANALLWNAVHTKMWRGSAEFVNILSDARVNPNISDPRPVRLVNSSRIHHRFIREPIATSIPTAPSDGDSRQMVARSKRGGRNHALQDFETQLMLLEQHNKKRLMSRAEKEKKTLLIWAAQTGSLDLFEAVLKNPRVDINSQDQNQQTALMLAVARNNEQMVAALLARPNTSVNLRDDQGRSAIFYAAEAGYENILKMLIHSKKVYLSTRDIAGKSAVEYAEQERHGGIVQIFRDQTNC